MSCSNKTANRTSGNIYITGANGEKSKKTFTVNLDFSLSFPELKKELEILLRCYPTAPYYNVERMLIPRGKLQLELNSDNLEELRDELRQMDKIVMNVCK